jgi:hypothetical protein
MSTLKSLSIHMLVYMSISFFVTNSKACDSMFAQFIGYALLKLFKCFFIIKLNCISSLLYALCHVRWSPLKICSISKKGRKF